MEIQVGIRQTAVSMLAIFWPVLASGTDKQSISLECGGTKAAITCTKFAGGECVATTLQFETASGELNKAPRDTGFKQIFETPFIADGLSCESTASKSVFVVWYSPGCGFTQCLKLNYFDTSGKRLTKHGITNRAAESIFGSELHSLKHNAPISLEGKSDQEIGEHNP